MWSHRLLRSFPTRPNESLVGSAGQRQVSAALPIELRCRKIVNVAATARPITLGELGIVARKALAEYGEPSRPLHSQSEG